MSTIGGVTGGVAAAIAAAEKNRQELEEETMTTYTANELRDDWEFKIIRSNFEAFRKPDTLHRVIEEEARAGWQFVEKFDNNRVRFKRSANAHANDHSLPPDVAPYRTHVGQTSATAAGIFIGMMLLLTLGLVLFTIMMAN